MSSNYDSVLSSRLELEAKVESASDERRSLLERCLGAESELERNRAVVVELRRKLDDSQAALHELGRENQSIQVPLRISGQGGFEYWTSQLLINLNTGHFSVH